MRSSFTINLRLVTFTTIVMGVMLSVFFAAPHAQAASVEEGIADVLSGTKAVLMSLKGGSPNGLVLGAEDSNSHRSDSGKDKSEHGRSSSDDDDDEDEYESDDDFDSSEYEDESESDDDSNKSDDKARGLERAASVVKREEIQNQITMIMRLIAQMREAMNGGGIGRELSEFIHNGRVLPDENGDDDVVVDQTLLSAALVSSVETFVENDDTTDEDNEGEYVLTLEVTASSSDLMIPTAASTEDVSTIGIVFSVIASSTDMTASGTASALLESTAATSGDYYVVSANTTETFTITVTFDPDEVGDEYMVQLEKVYITEGAVDLTPAEDFQSDYLAI